MGIVFFVFIALFWCIGDSICKRLDIQNFVLQDIADSLEQLIDNSK